MTSPKPPTEAKDIIHFWFDEIEPRQRWLKDPAFDRLITERFLSCHTRAAGNELASWRNSAEGRLAEIIVLDQFSRNIFRDTAQAFSHDAQALALAQEAIKLGVDKELNP